MELQFQLDNPVFLLAVWNAVISIVFLTYFFSSSGSKQKKSKQSPFKPAESARSKFAQLNMPQRTGRDGSHFHRAEVHTSNKGGLRVDFSGGSPNALSKMQTLTGGDISGAQASIDSDSEDSYSSVSDGGHHVHHPHRHIHHILNGNSDHSDGKQKRDPGANLNLPDRDGGLRSFRTPTTIGVGKSGGMNRGKLEDELSMRKARSLNFQVAREDEVKDNLEKLKKVISETHKEFTGSAFTVKVRSRVLKTNKVSYIGAPLEGGQRLLGCGWTPSVYRGGSYFKELNSLGWEVVDKGDLDFDALWDTVENKKPDPTDVNMNDCHKVGVMSKALADMCEQEARKGHFVLTVGGDHAVAFGSLAGVMKARPNTSIVWVDAHADINTPESSPSGNLHGMPMGAHLNISDFRRFPGWEWFDPMVHNGNIVFIGLRDLDSLEKSILRGLGAHVFCRHDIDKYGIGIVMSKALEIVNPFGNRPIHLSFDIDGIDPLFAPSTGTISPGGLTFRESRFICESLWATGCLGSMDLVEINPNILRGALAGHATEVITTDNVPKDVNELQMAALEQNPIKTLHMGWCLVTSALGETIC